MKKIIRLTESDLHNIIRNSVNKVLREHNDSLLLQAIAQALAQQRLQVNQGENDTDVELDGDAFAHIIFNVLCDPYMMQGMKSNSYDVPNDSDEIVDNPSVEVIEVQYCKDGECYPIGDNGLIKKALERVIEVDYTNQDIPNEQDYFSEY